MGIGGSDIGIGFLLCVFVLKVLSKGINFVCIILRFCIFVFKFVMYCLLDVVLFFVGG